MTTIFNGRYAAYIEGDFVVRSGQCESVYGNMPRFGLAAASGHMPAVGVRATARLRLEHQSAQPIAATIDALDPGDWRPEQPASNGAIKVA